MDAPNFKIHSCYYRQCWTVILLASLLTLPFATITRGDADIAVATDAGLEADEALPQETPIIALEAEPLDPAPGDPEPVDPDPLAAALLERAETDAPEAVREELNAALALWPDHPGLLRARGLLERRLGERTAAIATYERLLALDPADPLLPAILALLLREESLLTEGDRRLALLNRVHALVGEDPETDAALVLAAAALGQSAEAIRAYDRLPDERRRGAALLRAAANSYRDLGRDAEAVPLFAVLLDTHPDDRDIAAALSAGLIRADPTGAPARLDQLLARHPENMALLKARVLSSETAGDRWGALRGLQRLQALAPEDADLAAQRAARLLDLGAVGLARDVLAPHGEAIPAPLRAAVATALTEQQTDWERLPAIPEDAPAARLTILNYAEVTASAPMRTDTAAPEATDLATLIRHLEYLRGRGAAFINLAALTESRYGRKEPPPGATLLIFEQGHPSFDTLVLPVLEQYAIPVLLAVATGEIPDDDQVRTAVPRLSWERLSALAAHPLVSLASMSHSLGVPIPANPQGRLAPGSVTRRYDPATQTYETLAAYRERVLFDLQRSWAAFEERIGRHVDALVWPEGAYTPMALALAAEVPFGMHFVQTRPVRLTPEPVFPQVRVRGPLPLDALAAMLARWDRPAPPSRSMAMPVSLAPLVARKGDIRADLAPLIARIVGAGADTVHLDAGADTDGDGLVDAAFFPNRVLPLHTDILNHAVDLLRREGLRVWVVMPTLNFQPPQTPMPPEFRIMEFRSGQARPVLLGLPRLSPFHPQVQISIAQMYEDLALHVDADAVIFGPELYLTDREDFSPEAARVLRDQLEIHERNPTRLTPEQQARWTDLKVTTLENILNDARRTVGALHADIRFVRTLQPQALLRPADASAAYAQHFPTALARYDYILVDATPELFTPRDARAGLRELAQAVRQEPHGLARTTFAVGLRPATLGDAWLKPSEWRTRIGILRREGVRHFALHPDLGPVQDQPPLKDWPPTTRAALAD